MEIIRSKTTDKTGHQYRILTVDGKSFANTARHRKDCLKCVSERPIDTIDMEAWAEQATPAMEKTEELLRLSVEEAQKGNISVTCWHLRQVSKLMGGIPASPDGGLESELLARAGDAYYDAAYALVNRESGAAEELIKMATQFTLSAIDQEEAVCSAQARRAASRLFAHPQHKSDLHLG